MKQKRRPQSRQARLPRILVVETNPAYRSVVGHVVEIAGGQSESVAEMDQARKLLGRNGKFELVIIGVNADSPVDPKALAEVRTAAPVIILDETYNEALETFEAGAEQILPKPFVPDVLVGAIKAELRGPGPGSVVPLATKIELEGLVFDSDRRSIVEGAVDVQFTKREWEILSFLLASPNQYFRAEEILAQTWGTEASAEQLRTYITRIREKMAPFQAVSRLATEKGRGYCLVLQGASGRAQ
jgi:DNA-binding response OmpR family regulator